MKAKSWATFVLAAGVYIAAGLVTIVAAGLLIAGQMWVIITMLRWMGVL